MKKNILAGILVFTLVILFDALYLWYGKFPPIYSKNVSFVLLNDGHLKEVSFNRSHKISYKICYYWGGIIFRDYIVNLAQDCPLTGAGDGVLIAI